MMKQFKRLPRKKKKEFVKMGYDMALISRVRRNQHEQMCFSNVTLAFTIISEQEIESKRIKGYEPII